MARRIKLLKKMHRNPHGWRYSQLAAILADAGFELHGSRSTSHRTWIHGERPRVRVTIVDLGNRPLKPVYVEKVLEALEKVGYNP